MTVSSPYLDRKLIQSIGLDIAVMLPCIAIGIWLAALEPVAGKAIGSSGFVMASTAIVTLIAVWILVQRRRRQRFDQRRASDIFVPVLRAACVAILALYTCVVAVHPTTDAGFLLVGGFIALQWAAVGRLAIESVWPDLSCDRVLILGTGEMALSVAKELRSRNRGSASLIGFIKEERFDVVSEFPDGPVLGVAGAVESAVLEHRASRVIVALDDHWGVLPTAALVRLRFQGVEVEDAQTTISRLSGRVSLATVRPTWLIFTGGFSRSRLTLCAKRLIDILFSVAGLAITLPVMIVVAIAIKLESAGPIIYRQTRVGWRGRTFDVMKFRSMTVDAERNGAVWASVNDPRVTRIGTFIRKYRVDELPQFVNVLKGDMSLVGPRPERPVFVQELRKVIDYYDERHSMRPGLTGWAQVRYAYGASIEDAYRKLEYDLFYLKHVSFIFDLMIIGATVRVVLGGKHGR